jgi:hypothetical protein
MLSALVINLDNPGRLDIDSTRSTDPSDSLTKLPYLLATNHPRSLTPRSLPKLNQHAVLSLTPALVGAAVFDDARLAPCREWLKRPTVCVCLS